MVGTVTSPALMAASQDAAIMALLGPRSSLLDGPDVAYPERLNCAAELVDAMVARGQGGRVALRWRQGADLGPLVGRRQIVPGESIDVGGGLHAMFPGFALNGQPAAQALSSSRAMMSFWNCRR